MHNSRFTLIHESGSTKTTKEFNAYSTDAIFDNFAEFLRGCGFEIKGTIDILEDGLYNYDIGDDVGLDWTSNQIIKSTHSDDQSLFEQTSFDKNNEGL